MFLRKGVELFSIRIQNRHPPVFLPLKDRDRRLNNSEIPIDGLIDFRLKQGVKPEIYVIYLEKEGLQQEKSHATCFSG